MRKYLLPLLFIFFFIFESTFVELLPKQLFQSDLILVPRFLIITILFMTIYGGKKQGIIYGFIFGLLFDVVYTEIIGIYLFMFPLVAYIIYNLMRIFQSNIVVSSIISLIGVGLLELGVYELNYLIKVTDMDFSTFIEIRLLPTMILNLIFLVLLAYPIKRLFEKHAEELKNE